jgi:hypothetical protein
MYAAVEGTQFIYSTGCYYSAAFELVMWHSSAAAYVAMLHNDKAGPMPSLHSSASAPLHNTKPQLEDKISIEAPVAIPPNTPYLLLSRQHGRPRGSHSVSLSSLERKIFSLWISVAASRIILKDVVSSQS